MELPEVEALARARPWADQPWAAGLVADLPDVLAAAVGRWGVEIEGAHTDGAGLPVLEVRRGEPAAVVKFDGAGTALTQQVRVRCRPPTAAATCGSSTTLARAVDLARPRGVAGEPPGGRPRRPPCPNALRRDGSHAFVDPDGFLCEPEYDVALRDLRHHIDLLDAREGDGAGRRWHATLVDRVSAELGLDRERVAAWAFVERVTTGVWLGRLGYAEEGRAWLSTAARM